jgi:N-acetylglucosaminyldiphosphoundecaprenol N-acetyl-beta-D-mannosaminyltransferase
MANQRIDFLGLPLDTGVTLEDVCKLVKAKGAARLVTFITPQAWSLRRRYPDYQPALDKMSLVLPEGEGVARACRWLTKLPCPRLSFDLTSLADPFFRAAVDAKATLMLVGGEPGVDEIMQEELKAKYPDLKVVGTSHGFADFTPKVAAVMEKKADIVIVGMDPPRQENFLLALREAGFRGLALTCDDYFVRYTKPEMNFPAWTDRWHMRFAWRFYQEPQKLWRRYLLDYPLFVVLVAKALAEKYVFPWVQEKSARFREEAAPLVEKVAKKIESTRRRK